MMMINVPIHQNPGCEVESVASGEHDDELEEGKDDNEMVRPFWIM